MNLLKPFHNYSLQKSSPPKAVIPEWSYRGSIGCKVWIPDYTLGNDSIFNYAE